MTDKPLFLMTDARHFGVTYQINPWMRPDAWKADPAALTAAAAKSASALRGELENPLPAAGLTGKVIFAGLVPPRAVARYVGIMDCLAHLSRQKVRERFEQRFTARRMALDYLAAYRGLMDHLAPRLRLVSSEEAPIASASLAGGG